MPSTSDIDPLDQKLDNARLLGREEFLPESIELDERVAHLIVSPPNREELRKIPGSPSTIQAGRGTRSNERGR